LLAIATLPTAAESGIPRTGEPGLVSIVIPTYNRAYIIGQAIESVLAQTYDNVEVVVVDDGSTDDTAAVVGRYGPKVRYIRQANAGVSAARNRGLREARGEFLALLDSDDAWLPWKAEAQVAVLRAFPDVGMVWTDMVAVDAQAVVRSPRYLRTFYAAHRKVKIEEVCHTTQRLGDIWRAAPGAIGDRSVHIGEIFSHMVLGNLVHTSTAMLTRARLCATGLFDEGLLHSGEDYDFHLRTTMHGPVALLDEPSILYRVGAEDQLTSPDFAIYRARNNLTTVCRCLAHNAGRVHLSSGKVRRRLAEAHTWIGETELQVGENRKAMAALWQGIRYRPSARAAALLGLAMLPASSFWFEAARSAKRQIGRLATAARR
jgi:GT2 family glycosyltransferase